MDAIVVAVAACLTLALVLPWYVKRPFWFDELVSVEIADLSPRHFLDFVFGTEANMGLYHALLRPWLALGSGEGWVRALSIVFALGVLPILYGLAKRLFDTRTAMLSVLLLSVNVPYVGYARDARGYALTLLLVTSASYFLVRARDEARLRDWIVWAVTAGLAVWAHLFAGLVVCAQLVWLAAVRRSVSRSHALAALAVLAVVLLPAVAAVVLGGQGAQLDWLDPPTLRKLPGLFGWFVDSRPTLVVYFAGAVVALLAAYRGRDRRPYTLLLLWLLIPPALAFAFSYVSPVYLYRYFLFSLPALVLLVASGFARLRPLWLGIALAVFASALSARAVERCQPDCELRRDDWRGASAYVQAQQRAGDAIVVYPQELRTALDHYLGATRPRLLYPARWGLTGSAAEGDASLTQALASLGGDRRVWLVTWWLPSEPARRALQASATLVDEQEFDGNVHVQLFQTTAGA